jgi:hypothetical protein
MAIKFKGNLDAIFGNIYKKFEEQIIPSVIEAIEAVCIDIVNEAKKLDTYKDRTGNLRSSIGYVIYNDGKKVCESFSAVPVAEGVIEEKYKYKVKDGTVKTGVRNVKIGGEGESGAKSGSTVANEVAQSWPTGIVAVIVAGMDYALCVESKGYDVITGPASKLNQLLQEKFQTLKNVYK